MDRQASNDFSPLLGIGEARRGEKPTFAVNFLSAGKKLPDQMEENRFEFPTSDAICRPTRD